MTQRIIIFFLLLVAVPSGLRADPVMDLILGYPNLRKKDVRSFFNLLGEYARRTPLTLEQSRALLNIVNSHALTTGEPGYGGIVSLVLDNTRGGVNPPEIQAVLLTPAERELFLAGGLRQATTPRFITGQPGHNLLISETSVSNLTREFSNNLQPARRSVPRSLPTGYNGAFGMLGKAIGGPMFAERGLRSIEQSIKQKSWRPVSEFTIHAAAWNPLTFEVTGPISLCQMGLEWGFEEQLQSINRGNKALGKAPPQPLGNGWLDRPDIEGMKQSFAMSNDRSTPMSKVWENTSSRNHITSIYPPFETEESKEAKMVNDYIQTQERLLRIYNQDPRRKYTPREWSMRNR